MTTSLAVWGDPIAHSKSPRMQSAAYRVLGLDWEYGRRRVDAPGFASALAGLDERWRGLSLTMPLKEEAYDASVRRDRRAELTGAVNTLLLTGDGPSGFNTDIGGIVRALDELGLAEAERVRIVGAGSTAASALVALGECRARRVQVVARRPEKIHALRPIAEATGLELDARAIGDPAGTVDVTIATLPGGTVLPGAVAAPLAEIGGTLFDAAYDPWPSPLAQQWLGIGRPAHPGREMLLHQGVLQVRIFVNGAPDRPLDGEEAVAAAMRAALMED